MHPDRTFVVRPRLPEELSALRDVALNLRWAWDERAQELFRRIDPEGWERGRHDPFGVIAAAGPARLEELAGDGEFTGLLEAVREELEEATTRPRWFQERPAGPLRSVAYFSPEFGIAEAIPQYSGGLGVLAGDHLKAADDLGLPLIGVGLLYHHGYFRQALDPSGWQREHYPTLDPFGMALLPVSDLLVEVDLAGVPVSARVWRAQVGRIPLYLLDANIEENDPESRLVTDRLYGGGQEHRLRQELLLGVGGVRALEGAGHDVQIFHMNEGHAGFLALERIRRLVTETDLSFEAAVEVVRAGTIFTTHTSVPAGIDRFPVEMMRRYFEAWAAECGIEMERFLELGREPGDAEGAVFNMAAMGFRLSGVRNGVSELHGRVSRRLFADLWPGTPVEEVPITSITNGTHARSWVSPDMGRLLERAVGTKHWHAADAAAWAGVTDLPDVELWGVRTQARLRLVDLVRSRVRRAALERGASTWDLEWCDELLDPGALTIGFARRFAGYKRATLLLSEPERLLRLLGGPDRPVQLVFAGKAHPADDQGKEMIRRIVEFSHDRRVRSRLVFVEDYDIALGRALVQGCDVWLNTPRRPQEASGTSGMKAVLNGVLNCSVLDGWWDEMFDGHNGWAIASAEHYEDLAQRDEVEVNGLFDLLEQHVVPLFYEHDDRGVPQGWIHRIKASLRTLGPQVTASRMVRDYVIMLYEPAAVRHEAIRADGSARAKDLAGRLARLRQAWDTVVVEISDEAGDEVGLGEKRTGRCQVRGAVEPGDIAVHLLHGPLDVEDRMEVMETVLMERTGEHGGWAHYEGTFEPDRAGRYGFKIRVVPRHPDLTSWTEAGLAPKEAQAR